MQDFMSKSARIRYVRYADDIAFAMLEGANSEMVSQGALIIQIRLCTLRRLVRPDRKKNFLLLFALCMTIHKQDCSSSGILYLI